MQKIEKTKNNFQTNNGFQNTFPQKIPYRISTQHPDPVIVTSGDVFKNMQSYNM